MRLINVETMQLEEFMVNPPPYAILSHTWGAEEVDFACFTNPDPRIRERMEGWNKIKNVCKTAQQNNLMYAWVDTCCIDKSSSAELSEAINSMYSWYAHSEICYAFLEDVPPLPRIPLSSSGTAIDGSAALARHPDFFTHGSDFARSRWFRRGWTLQELVAPLRLDFFSRNWKMIERRGRLRRLLSGITGIPQSALNGSLRVSEYSIGTRLSWAASRETTRPEDVAYSLLGLLDISMPLLYGEGSRAFRRLQEEILRQHEDDTLFLWRTKRDGGSAAEDSHTLRGVMADSPSEFGHFRDPAYHEFRGDPTGHLQDFDSIESLPNGAPSETALGVDSRGVRLHGLLEELTGKGNCLLWLNSVLHGARIGISVERISEHRYARTRPSEIFFSRDRVVGDSRTVILLNQDESIAKYLGVGSPSGFHDLASSGSITCGFHYGFYLHRTQAVAGNYAAQLESIYVRPDSIYLPHMIKRPEGVPDNGSWQPLVASTFNRSWGATTRVFLTFRYSGGTLRFLLVFERLPQPWGLGASGITLTPAGHSTIALYMPSNDEGFDHLAAPASKIEVEAEASMTFADAQGTAMKPPMTLTVAHPQLSNKFQLSVKLGKLEFLHVWVIDLEAADGGVP